MLKWALSGDQQFPRNDPKAISLWFNFLREFQPDVVDYLGDTEDQDEYSRWQEGRSKEFLKANADNMLWPMDAIHAASEPTRTFYSHTRELLPDAEIHLCLGNHDKRVFEYVDKKLPDLSITAEWLWNLDELNISYIRYEDLPVHRYGGWFVHHGNAVSKHAGESVKADMEAWNVSLIRGHSHRLAHVFKTYEIGDRRLQGIELGHMCDPKQMDYSNVRNWQQGFAYGYIDGDRAWVNIVPIADNHTAIVEGQVFDWL